MRRACRRRRLEPADPSRQPGRRPADIRRGAPRLRAGRAAREVDRGRRHATASSTRRRAAADGARAGARAARACGFAAETATGAVGRAQRVRRQPSAALRDPGEGQGLRRSAERRDLLRRAARAARGLRIGRAPEALHDARHGRRPGQDVEPERPHDPCRSARAPRPRRRHDALPPALQSGQPRRARRARARRATCSRSAARRSTTGTSRPARR